MDAVLHRVHGLSVALVLLFFATALGGGLEGFIQEGAEPNMRTLEQLHVTRRRLVGVGSFPPTCRGRCGSCFPCGAVHVTIQPGLIFPLEYYPEAWRCKCGSKLFMP
ncbi:EPIDERMAL PATTERNING FACTOR-like protein 5 [Typha latifolia]|uniref:EPIDERMAL PATTERNING FACTOR-like protein 5 n=1 Tax=Typha latifolia TaxID=4733 RepID=UPI003C308A51